MAARTLIDDYVPEDLCNSPLNTSKAKMMYSFGKSERFGNKAFKSPCTNAFYDLPHHLFRSTRAAGFGKGGKFDFTKGNPKTPGPCGYQIKRNLANQTQNFSFGLGRGEVSLGGVVPKRMFHGEAPGPGTYPIGSTKSSIQYSFRRRLKPSLSSNAFAPAPNKYNVPESINQKGVYANSKFSNSRAPRISISAHSRFKSFDQCINNPAPGKYGMVDTINQKGIYNSSKFKNSLCRSFSTANRNTLGINPAKKSAFPGPGNYRLPSEFGYYISSEGKKMMRSASAPKLLPA